MTLLLILSASLSTPARGQSGTAPELHLGSVEPTATPTPSPAPLSPAGLTITLFPEEAVSDGAQWRLLPEGGWRGSGDRIEALAPGIYTVEARSLVDWSEPPPEQVLVIAEVPIEFELQYLRLPEFSLRIESEADPEELNPVVSQEVWHGETLEFLVRDSETSLTMILSNDSIDDISFDSIDGLFRYRPAPNEKRAFDVTFLPLEGAAEPMRTISILPRPDLRPEQENLNILTTEIPAKADEKYLIQTVRTGPTELFNDAERQTRVVDVVGIEVVIEENSLQNELYQFHEAEDIKELNITAETVIFRSPLVLPQANVTIRARELRFEDPEGALRGVDGLPSVYLDVTPRARSLVPGIGVSGDPGHDAGAIDLFIEKFHSENDAGPRLIARGGAGGPGGTGQDGTNGRSFSTLTREQMEGIFNFPEPDSFFAGVVQQRALCAGGPCTNLFTGIPTSGQNATPPGSEGQGGKGGVLVSPFPLAEFADLNPGQNGPQATPPERGFWKGGNAGTPSPYYRMDCCFDLGGILDPPSLTLTKVFLGTTSPGTDAFVPEPLLANSSGQNLIEGSPNDWVHPLTMQQILRRAKDAYFIGNLEGAGDILDDYDVLLELYFENGLGSHLDGYSRLQLTDARDDMASLLHRIDSGLDYYGNPAGWVPMLSFEANFIALDAEAERAIPILYATYWLNDVASTLEERARRLESMREELRASLEALEQELVEAQNSIVPLQAEADVISNRLDSTEQEILRRLGYVAYLNQYHRVVATLEKIIKSAKYMDDLNSLAVYQPALRPRDVDGLSLAAVGPQPRPSPEDRLVQALINGFTGTEFADSQADYHEELLRLNGEGLTADEIQHLQELMEAADKNRAAVQKFWQQQSRALRGKRRPRGKLFQRAQPRVQEERARVMADFAPELGHQLTEIAEQKLVFVEKLANTLQTLATVPQEITQILLAIDAIDKELTEVNESLSPRAQSFINEMERRQFDRLEKYFYYMRKSYEYRMLRRYPGELNLEPLFDEFRALADSGTEHLTADQIEALLAVYKEQLGVVAAAIFDELNASAIEREAVAQTSLTATEREQLNETGSVTINLLDRGMFGESQENIRIVCLETFKDPGGRVSGFQVSPEGGPFGENSTVRLRYRHSGLSRLRSQGKTYFFRHFRTEDTNPIFWETTYIPFDGSLMESRPSAASNSLLRTLLELEGKDFDDLLLYSRPGAWADIVIAKEFTQGIHDGTDPIATGAHVDQLRLTVVYDYFPMAGDQVSLNVESEGFDGMLPYIVLNKDDLDRGEDGVGRQDGRGSFRRVYSRGEQVSLEAEADYGVFAFREWVQGNGESFDPPVTSTTLDVSLGTSQTVRATYEPIPGAMDLGSVISHLLGMNLIPETHRAAADGNGDEAIDIGDVRSSLREWQE